MLTVSLRELHRSTGKIVHQAATQPVEITERGRVVARLGPIEAEKPSKKSYALPNRDAWRKKHLAFSSVDSADLISEDREDRF